MNARSVPLYQIEFPDYGPLDFTPPMGFVDTSWHNDVCPSFEGDGLKLFADYKDVLRRESAMGERFALALLDSDGILQPDFTFTSDNYEHEVVPFITALRPFGIQQRKWIAARVLRTKAEIVAAVGLCRPFADGGRVPSGALDSYADLRAYCNPTELGGLYDPQVRRDGLALFPTFGTSCDALNVIRDTIDRWMASGSMRAAALALGMEG